MPPESAPAEQKEQEKMVVSVSPEELALIESPETTHVTLVLNAMENKYRLEGALNAGTPEGAKEVERIQALPKRYGTSDPIIYTKEEALAHFNFEAASE